MIVVISLDFGSSTIKSIEIADQALSGVESSESKPYGLCLGILDLAQISQDLMNFLTSLFSLGH